MGRTPHMQGHSLVREHQLGKQSISDLNDQLSGIYLLAVSACAEPVRVLDTQRVRTQMLADSLLLASLAQPSSPKTAELQSPRHVGRRHRLRLAEDPLSLLSLHCASARQPKPHTVKSVLFQGQQFAILARTAPRKGGSACCPSVN